MRLIDELLSNDGQRRSAAMPERFGDIGELLDDCPLRYVLDPSVADECSLMIEQGSAAFLLEEQLSVPAPSLWLEWRAASGEFHDCPHDFGLLIVAEAGQRRGALRIFYRHAGARATASPAIVEFDFDHASDRAPRGAYDYPLQHGCQFSAASFAKHSMLRVDPICADRKLAAVGQSGYRRWLRELAEFAWVHLPFAFAFFVLLSTPSVLDRRPTDYRRLNIARRKRGQRDRKDQIEVRLNLGCGRGGQPSAGHAISRLPSRRHLVRGHLVNRDGKIFWRCTHLRGREGSSLRRRTVYVQRSRSQS